MFNLDINNTAGQWAMQLISLIIQTIGQREPKKTQNEHGNPTQEGL